MNLNPEQIRTFMASLPGTGKTSSRSAAVQDRKIRHMVNHAYKHVPFYRDWFDRAKIVPQDIRKREDLRKIPPISKQDLKQQIPQRLLAQNFNSKRLGTFATSGSTGVPLRVRRSRFEDILFHLIRMQIILAYGLKRSDKFVRIRGSSNDKIPFAWKLAQKLRFYRQVMLSTFDPPEVLSHHISQEKPDVLTGYAGALVRIAQTFTENDAYNTVQPRFLVSGGDMLTPHGRHYIKQAFNAPVFDTYESQEVGLMAWQCPQSHYYHTCENSTILEVLKNGHPAKEGEQGEIVATSLNCYAFPFIRYKLEDLVTVGPSPCTCGHAGRTFHRLNGRKTDYFKLPGGFELNPWLIDILLYNEAVWVEQYEVIQEKEDMILLNVVLPPDKSIELLEPMRIQIQEKLGDAVKFRIESVTEIKPGPSGKNYYHRSLVQTASARTYE